MSAATNGDWARALVDALVTGGARHAVISPGSRSTPIVLALHHLALAGQVTLHDVLDERSAGFFGLGLARMTGQPVLLACTSGSAGAHYLPAIIEASHDRLPLIALTADRPPELHGVGAPQTTEQGALFGAHVRLMADPGAPTEGASPETMHALGTQALDAAMGSRPGPVHLNLPFRKPLWEEPSAPHQAPPSRPPVAVNAPSRQALDSLAGALTTATRGVIVCGPGDLGCVGRERTEHLSALRAAVGRLADALGWPVIIDAASSLRTPPEIPGAVFVGDTLSRAAILDTELAPDHVLRLGQIPTSTPLRRWLARHGHSQTSLIDASGVRHDPDHLDATLTTGDPVRTLTQLAEQIGTTSVHTDPAWARRWRGAAAAVGDAQRAAVTEGPLWAGSVAHALARALPQGGLLHVASSLAIRALDAFGGATTTGTQITANRGVNGIDGTLATTFGQATAWGGATAVMLGDLAFLHDLGSLVTLGSKTDGPPLVVVVLDNQGGGLFDHLPIAEHPTAHEPHFVAPPRADIATMGQTLPGVFTTVSDTAALGAALEAGFSRPGLTIVHAPFDRAYDLSRHQATWALGVTALDGEVA